eukprot:gene4184-5955_t
MLLNSFCLIVLCQTIIVQALTCLKSSLHFGKYTQFFNLAHGNIRFQTISNDNTAENIRFRSKYLTAKKKGSKSLISDDILSSITTDGDLSLDSEGSKDNISNSNNSQTIVTEKKSIKSNKKINKFGLSDELLSSLIEDKSVIEEESEDQNNSNNNNESSKSKKKKNKNKNNSDIKFDEVDESEEDHEKKDDGGVDHNNIKNDRLKNYSNEDNESNSNDDVDGESQSDAPVADPEGLTIEQRVRKEKPSSRIRFTESSQPGFVLMGLEKVGVMYGNEVILKDATFTVTTGERVGLVGPNGSGKSTQLKILANELEATTGDVVKSSANLRVAFLRQEFTDQLVLNRTLKEELLASFLEEIKILEMIAECEEEVGRTTDDPEKMELVLNKLQSLQEEAISKGAYSLESKVEKIMDATGFALEDSDALVSSFSGGWKMRIGLAKILLLEPNVLLLDEPTNHLDLDSVIWLESFLPKQNIPMIIVSHDREFLDKVCNKIVDVEDGATVSYQGNYSKFIEQRRNRLEVWREKYERQSRYVKEEEKWIKKAKNDPNMAQQVKAKEMALEKYKNNEDWVAPPPKDKKFRFRFPAPPRCGESVLEAVNLKHGYGDGKYKVLFENVEFKVEKGNRIGFIGPNGSGKSTMMKIIMGLETPQKGYAEFGSNSIVANYYAQNQADALDLTKTVLETVQEGCPPEYSFTEIRGLLGQFMFKGDDVYKKLSVLSGGEKARVALCKMMLTPANLLLLDEPTNHLDIASKEVLEEALLAYTGSVLIISHDRYFMSQVSNTIFEFNNKAVVRHDCDYHDYMMEFCPDEQLKEKVTARYVEGDGYRITNAKEVVEEEKANKKTKNFGGSGVTSGNLYKGIKNAKRFTS